MAGLGHLFNFNEALSGRKLSVNKAHGGGLEATRRSHVERCILAASKYNKEEILRTPENKNSSGSNTKLPILQDMTTESSRGSNQSPSVVARLMGLDTLPSDAKRVPASTVKGKCMHNEEASFPHNFKPHAKMGKAPDSVKYQTALSHGGDTEDYKGQSLSFSNHPQEKQLQEFKKEFQAWQSHKTGDQLWRPGGLADSIGSQVAVKDLHAYEKQADMKYGLLGERFSSSSKPYYRPESKDVLDAMNFLQSNKEYFVECLQNSDPSLVRHLQGNEAGLQAGQIWQSSKRSDSSKGLRPHPEREDFTNTRKSFTSKQPNWRSELDPIVNRKSLSGLSYNDYEHLGRLSSSPARNNQQMSVEVQVPTRIVVLKPGKVRDAKNIPTIHSCSPKEVVTDHHIEILEKLRAKLSRESGEMLKHEKKCGHVNLNGQYLSRDPRGLAREIARQVRENVTRELMHDAQGQKSGRGANLIRQILESANKEDAFQSRKAYLDGYDVSVQQTKNSDRDDTSNKERRQKGNGRFHMLSEDLDDGPILQFQHPMDCRKGKDWQDPCAEASQKEQCQIEDAGPALDNVSSVSSLSSLENNSTDTEKALIVENLVAVKNGLQEPPIVEREPQVLEVDLSEELSSLVFSNNELSYSMENSPSRIIPNLPKEQPDNPSPISVLSLPFQDEAEVPFTFKEQCSDLQELRTLCLRQYNEDDTKPISLHNDSTGGEDPCVANESSSCDHANISDCRFDVNDLKHVDDKVACPSSEELEMFYVKALLSASGLTTERPQLLTSWHAPHQPLDPCLFKEMEVQFFGKVSEGDLKQESVLDSSSRHLLFDIVNDDLLEALGPHTNSSGWTSPSKIAQMPMPSGKDLILLVWSHVSQRLRLQSEGQETLEKLMHRDLTKPGQWFDHVLDAEAVGLDMERSILSDLLEETLLIL